MKRAVITNGQLRKSLACVRSLGQKGIRTIVMEETRCNPASFSKWCGKTVVCPNPDKSPREYVDCLRKTLVANAPAILFPMDDNTLRLVMENRDTLGQYAKIPLPSNESYRIASDKGKSAMLAIEAGLDCPATIMPESTGELSQIASDIGFPAVIKPRRSSGSRGIRVVCDRDELMRTYLKLHEEYPYPIIQEHIPTGDRYDVCLLFDFQSRPKAFFVQRELRHFPLEMGPSTVQESVWYPELVEKSLKLMDKLNWCGVAEIEFMVDRRDGKPKFMEINSRFWNSLCLSIVCGVDFPWLLYRLAAYGDVEEVFDYKTGVMCRWFAGDILHFICDKNRFGMNPPFWAGRKHNVHDDIISWEDPLPAAGFMLSCARYLFDRGMWKFFFRR